jgi:hypothetical protein
MVFFPTEIFIFNIIEQEKHVNINSAKEWEIPDLLFWGQIVVTFGLNYIKIKKSPGESVKATHFIFPCGKLQISMAEANSNLYHFVVA